MSRTYCKAPLICATDAPTFTLEIMEQIAATDKQAIFPVSGDCMEGMDIMDSGKVLVDFTRFPVPPRCKSEGGDGSVDACLCWAEDRLMVKEYIGRWGPWQMVSTRYADQWKGGEYRQNGGIRAERIFGVILASWDRDGVLLWERDPSEFPEELCNMPTIHGVNVDLGSVVAV